MIRAVRYFRNKGGWTTCLQVGAQRLLDLGTLRFIKIPKNTPLDVIPDPDWDRIIKRLNGRFPIISRTLQMEKEYGTSNNQHDPEPRG